MLKARRVATAPAHEPGSAAVLRRRRHALVVVLTFVTGSADATGFLALGGAFSSVMTGNMVLERARIGGSVVWWGGGFFDVFEGERFQFGDQFSEAAGVVQ